MVLEIELKKLVRISYLSQEYQKLISYINTIRMVDCQTANKYFLLELHVRLMSFLFASYNDSQKFKNTPEIILARKIRDIYTHNIHDKVINCDFLPVNIKYCEPYIVLNSEIDKNNYRTHVTLDNIIISSNFIVPSAVMNSDQSGIICINLFEFINNVYKIVSDFYK